MPQEMKSFMIKDIDALGAVVVLLSYPFLVSSSILIFFAIITYFLGVAISTIGLVRQDNQKAIGIYVILAVGAFCSVFLSFGVFGEWIWVMIYAIPATIAFSSLTLASRTKENTSEQIERKGAPF